MSKQRVFLTNYMDCPHCHDEAAEYTIMDQQFEDIRFIETLQCNACHNIWTNHFCYAGTTEGT